MREALETRSSQESNGQTRFSKKAGAAAAAGGAAGGAGHDSAATDGMGGGEWFLWLDSDVLLLDGAGEGGSDNFALGLVRAYGRVGASPCTGGAAGTAAGAPGPGDGGSVPENEGGSVAGAAAEDGRVDLIFADQVGLSGAKLRLCASIRATTRRAYVVSTLHLFLGPGGLFILLHLLFPTRTHAHSATARLET